MRAIRLRIIAPLLGLFCATAAHAQLQPSAQAPNTEGIRNAAVPKIGVVPNVIRFGGSFHPSNGMLAQPVESVTLSVYRDQTGGTALWQETQNVAVDGQGRYSVLMGSTQNGGVPLDLLSAGEPRWLGAQFNRPGELEQPRVLMASVPYALQSVDAEMLGGKPASAYLLAGPTSSGMTASAGAGASTTVLTNTTASVKPRVTSGTAGFIGVFTDSTDLGNSVMYQSGGNIGVATTSPLISLDVRTGSLPQMGIAQTTDYLAFYASDTYGPVIYWDPTKDMRFGKGGAGLYNPVGFTEQVRIQSSTGNVGIGTQIPASKLDVAGDINLSGNILYQGFPVLRMPGTDNLALGNGALNSHTTGAGNMASGGFALPNNTTGSSNTASGAGTLYLNTTGNKNTAAGNAALYSNTTGSGNTASGVSALEYNTTGSDNTAIGTLALENSATTSLNTAVGYQALQGGPVQSVNTGVASTALGALALQSNTTGSNNTAVGSDALGSNTTGSNNTACGFGALNGNTSGANNIAIGYEAGSFYGSPGNSNNIYIGNGGSQGDGSGVIRIGTPGTQTSFFVAGVNGVTTTNSAVPVLIDTMTGQLGVASSSRRYKEDIEDMGEASRDLMRLRPVTFRYKKPFADGSKPIQYGLIAEDVDEVYPDLVAHSADGQIETVKYQLLPAMLLNEVQRQQAEIERLEERLAKLESILSSMSAVSAVAGRAIVWPHWKR